MIFGLFRGDGEQRNVKCIIFGHGSDVNFCVLVRSRLICVKIVNQTQQHNDTKNAIRSISMFPVAGARSEDICSLF